MTSKSLKSTSGLMWQYFLKYGPHSMSVKVSGATHFKKSSSFMTSLLLWEKTTRLPFNHITDMLIDLQ